MFTLQYCKTVTPYLQNCGHNNLTYKLYTQVKGIDYKTT